jgi:glycosyltransferase involved in cell wall biosynthesis
MISIITPVYNGEKYIEACIENVIEQKCPDIEHIIVDGGSTDRTVEIIRKYAEKYPHILWVSEKDKGQSDAMNKGIAMAKGLVIGILNVDDCYEPNVLCRILEIFKGLPEPSLLVGNSNVWDNDGKLWFVSKPYRISFENLLSGRFLEAFPMNPAGYFYHASLHRKIGLYKTDEHFAMDVEFMLKAVQSAHITYVDEMFGNYRYLIGTKTFMNDQSGETQKIVRSIIYRYLREMPLMKRLKLILRYELPRNRIWQIVKSYSKRK